MSDELARRVERFLSRQLPARCTQSAPGLSVGTLVGPRTDNQDKAATAFLSFPSGESILIAIVCDGLGGMSRGSEAAACAVGGFIGRIAERPRRSLKTAIADAVLGANHDVHQRLKGDGGTTLAAVVVANTREAWIVHVGDSRVYQHGPADMIKLLTRDDTIAAQVLPQSSRNDDLLDNRLLQFVGIGPPIEPHIILLPYTPQSSFLLTSDGAHSIGKRSLEGILSTSSSASEIVRKLLYVAEATGVEDNSSAISISMSEFEAPLRSTSGTEMTIWSPNQRLEIWFESPKQSLSLGAAETRSQPSSTDDTPAKPKRQGRSRQKTKKTDHVDTAPEPSVPPRPQLNIEFGSSDEGEK